MKILLVSGHTSGYNADSKTKVNEGDLNIEVIKILKPLLEPYADVDVYPYDRDMYLDNKNGCLKVSLSKYDYIYEQHFNAFNGTARGAEVMIHSKYTKDISVELAIADAIASFGITKRHTNGIYRSTSLMNMNTAYRLGVKYCLVETCFYDSAADIAIYKAKKNEIIQKIADAIISKFGLKKTSSTKTSSSSSSSSSSKTTSASKETKISYYVGTGWKDGKCQNQHGAFSSLDNAKNDADTAKKETKKSYYVFDTSGKKVYPVAEKTTTASSKKVTVTSSELNVRKAANITDKNVLVATKKGTELEYLDTVTGTDGTKMYKCAVYVSASSKYTKLS